jgi:hypothetical protein
MADDPIKAKWTPVDPATAEALTNQTQSPGRAFRIGPDAVPEQLRNLPGAVAFYASTYITAMPLPLDVKAELEVTVVRHDGDTGKAYNYLFATSTDSKLYFHGPHKDFAAHHFNTASSVSIGNLFGHPFVVRYQRKP